MKVLYVMASIDKTVGGMEKQLALQANLLAQKQAHEVSVVAASHFEQLFDPSVDFRPANMAKSRRSPSLLFALTRYIRELGPDIVHAHGHKAAAICSYVRFLFPKIRFVGTAHNLKKNNAVMSKMDTVIAVSEGVQNNLLPIKSHVVLNGVECQSKSNTSKKQFCAELGLNESLPLVLGLGRLVKTKQFELLVKAAASLPLQVVILGDGPERQHLQSIAPDNVIFAGYRNDARDILQIADLLVITAKRDGFSLALIEALHSCLPVFSTRVPGAQDLLPENCLIDNDDTGELASMLSRFIAHPSEYKQSFEPIFEFARKELTVEKAVSRTEAIYHQLVRGS